MPGHHHRGRVQLRYGPLPGCGQYGPVPDHFIQGPMSAHRQRPMIYLEIIVVVAVATIRC